MVAVGLLGVSVYSVVSSIAEESMMYVIGTLLPFIHAVNRAFVRIR